MGPGAGEAHVEMEGVGFLAGELLVIRRGDAKLRGGAGVGTGGGVGGGELGHHEEPDGRPGGSDGGD